MQTFPINEFGQSLLVTLPRSLDDETAKKLQSQLINRAAQEETEKILVDISALEIVDSYMARILDDIASSVRIMGADAVVVGMKPSIAITLVELGIDLSGIKTATGVEQGMRVLK